MPNQVFTSSLSTAPPLTASSLYPSSSSIDGSAHNTAPETFFDSLPLPRLMVFDLDYTLWPFWVDTHISLPIKPKDSNTRVQDRWGESFSFYPGVPNVLHAARERGITMSVASRTHTPEIAKNMLKSLVVTPPFNPNVEDGGGATSENQKKKNKTSGNKPEKAVKAFNYFAHMQIFPGSKTTHFQRIQEATQKTGDEVPFADMLFFDDEARNRNVETELGVTFWLVRDGVSKDEVDKGVREWRKKRGIASASASAHAHQLAAMGQRFYERNEF